LSLFLRRFHESDAGTSCSQKNCGRKAWKGRGGGGGLKPPLSYEKRRRSPGLFGRRTPAGEQIAVSSEQSAINAEKISAFMLIAVC